MSADKTMRQGPRYINPYFGGVLLGLLLLLTMFITGRGLGASGAVKSAVVTTMDKISPVHAEHNIYYSKFLSSNHSPMFNWLVFESLGIFFGGLLSGALYGRLKKPRIEHSPKISGKTRLWAAGIGGVLFGVGSQFGRGCSSGAALSGTASFSFGGFLVMMLLFGTGYVLAYFFKKLWI
ncbi:MAG: YeeE/YedE family protein [Bacteroidales bacterium]|nr:YeeE/YedE family protein [Bacteroidales bacterium]